MTGTTRWYHNLGISHNPYWFMHELKEIRRVIHRRYRHNNRIAMRKLNAFNQINLISTIDIEIEPRTRGWLTY